MIYGKVNLSNKLDLPTASLCPTFPSWIIVNKTHRYQAPATCHSLYSGVITSRAAATKIYAHSENISSKDVTSSSPDITSESQDEQVDEKFNWFKNWWAVQVVDNLETDRPNKIQLLNKDYIVWKGHSGNWIAMDDECPHRMAPLSEGRIEKDGNLLCSYHAWRFNESGKCVKIPHAEDEKAHTVACNSPRSAVQTYPCKTRGSLLWIWPDDSASAFDESSETQLPMDDDLADFYENHAGDYPFSPYVRIFPYSYDVLMEMFVDPARMPIAYHGLVPGFSRYNAAPINMKRATAVGDKPILDAVTFKNPPISAQVYYEIRLPGLIAARSRDDKGRPIARDNVFVRPVTSGKSMMIMTPATETAISNPKKASFFKKLFLQFIKIEAHAKVLNKIFDSNIVLLHEQDKNLKKRGSRFAAKNNYFMPNTEDTLVTSFREWFETIGERGAAFGGDQLSDSKIDLSKKELLDRYEQHTKHCKLSSQGLKTVRTAISVLKSLCVLSSFIASVLLIKELSTNASLNVLSIVKNIKLMTSAVFSCIFLSISMYLEEKIIPLFYFEDHSYADMD
eukprot:g1709.t1